jgi:hypothetical protein
MQVNICRDASNLPQTTDREDHLIVGVHLCDRHNNPDPLDDRFSITFQTASGRNLRIRLPANEMARLGHGLLDMVHERAWRDEPMRWRDEPCG